mmetsp:Transcript_2693/g.3694  ORF Transcript_2693/g.3694 Transcript_2693/m.3694 type:complete len:439 (+) Transcript_2693:81-1397(+)
MGIQGLTKLLCDECPGCIKEIELSSLTGRKIAIDASMAMYQFLIAVRSRSDGNSYASMLTNEAGEVTSHLQGMFHRTIRLLSNGIKPVYVFDGKPPTMKSGELLKREAKRVKAEADHSEAKETGTAEDVDKFSKRLVHVTKQNNDDCKTLLQLMGVPVVNALCEAEAQCAAMAKGGLVFATGTEDMDALTFKTPKLIRKLTFGQNSKQPILELDYQKILDELKITHDEFVDLCILCGCDYTENIKGIGPKKALAFIRKYHSIEKIIENLDAKKYKVPKSWVSDIEVLPENGEEDRKEVERSEESTVENGNEEGKGENGGIAETSEGKKENREGVPMYVEARRLFLEPEVYPCDSIEIKWTDPNVEELKDFLVTKMQFSEDRVDAGIKKLQDARKKGGQTRMDSFFKVVSTSSSSYSGKRPEPSNAGKGRGRGAKRGRK